MMFNWMQSPIRKALEAMSEDQLTIFEEDQLKGSEWKRAKIILSDVETMLETMEAGAGERTRIAVMGEVNAGKSTFVNACTNRPCAYTDVLEATAIVSEITWGETEQARLIGKNGEVVRRFTLEEMLEWMEDMVDDEGDSSGFARLEVDLPCDLLRSFIFVDTPGLLSITSENHEVTNHYIAKADYILWVINSRDLGSEAVNDYLKQLSLSGKPMLGIINKVDTPEQKAEIQDYVEREYGKVFDELFFVSSSRAWEARQAGREDWEAVSGFTGVLDCLADLAEDKEGASRQTEKAQLRREKAVHERMKALLQVRKQHYDEEISKLAQLNRELKTSATNEWLRWLEEDFYRKERETLLQADDETFLRLLQEYGDAVYLTRVIRDKDEEIQGYLAKKWKWVVRQLSAQTVEVLLDFSYDPHFDPESASADQMEASAARSKRPRWQGSKRGAKTGTIIGVAFAGYSAWLGPAAASVTFAGALLPAVIPLTLTGAAAGVMMDFHRNAQDALRDRAEAAQKKSRAVEELYIAACRAAQAESNNVIDNLNRYADYFYEQRCAQYREAMGKLNFDFEEPAYSRFMQELADYLRLVDDALNRRETPEAPPPMEGVPVTAG